MTKGIYKFSWDCGRGGDVESTFIATAEDVSKIQGKHVYFGEIAGKHSEVYGTIDDGDITLITDNPEFIAQYEVFMGADFSTGHNPFDYLDDVEEEDAE
jgi:phenolic acid decarboxylase